jgi:hypothetical protein
MFIGPISAHVSILNNKFTSNLAESSGVQIKKASTYVDAFFIWWAHQDLNLGPKDYESSALTN